ncbi:MAG: alpha/beta hydrolase [Xanthomonadales bacterium]|nr:alpha/beta hydrolase [Xanthomonadales bacterium]
MRVAILGVAWVAAQAEPTPGGWIGWAYLGDGGDLPLRVWFEQDAEGLVARFDGVPWRQRGWTSEVRLDGSKLSLVTATPKGTAIELSGTVESDRWSGTAEFADYSGDFELLHAPGLADIAPESYAELAGFYRMSDGDVVEAKPRPWGEIVLRSIRTGQQRTLLPTGPDTFMTGPARYLPTPVEARYEVIHGEDGGVTLLRKGRNGETSRGESFQLRSREIKLSRDGVELAATITEPDDRSVTSGVALLGGATWESRDTVAFWTRNLAALGFAVIAWDRRGHGESGGEAPSAFEVTAGDAVAAAAVLREQGVSPVGYFGISRGGWTAPRAAATDPSAAFLMLLVPPATTPAVQEQSSRVAQLRADGLDGPALEAASRALEAAWRFASVDSDDRWKTYAERRRAALAMGIPEDVLPPSERDPESWRWSRLNMHHDPRPDLASLRIPVLALYGELDANVLPLVHRPLMADALDQATDVTLVTIPGVPHNLGRSSELPHHRSTGVGAEGFDMIMEWARARGMIE